MSVTSTNNKKKTTISSTPNSHLRSRRISCVSPEPGVVAFGKEQIEIFENKIHTLQEQLRDAKIQIKNLSDQINEGIVKQKTSSTLIETTLDDTSVNSDKTSNKPKLIVVGTQQCSGLSEKLMKARENTMYENYQVSGFIKPNAPASEVLKTVHTLKIGEKDKVVLCVGENDSDPMVTTSELYCTLKSLKHTTVIVISVINNNYINQIILNSQLNLICKKFVNCKFLYIDRLGRNYPLNVICQQVNVLIDSLDYERKFLDINYIKKHILNGKQIVRPESSNNLKRNNFPRSKQTSILEYFYPINCTHSPQSVSKFFR